MNERECKRGQGISERAQALFADSVSGLDAATRSRLAQARARAVEAAESGAGTRSPLFWRLAPWAGAAAAALVVALIWQADRAPARLEEASVIADLDILLDGDSLELIEDLDFYAWLLEQPELLEEDAAPDGNG